MPSGMMGAPSVPAMSPGINFGMPGGVPPVPGTVEDPSAQAALAALESLVPKGSPNPTEGLAKVEEALELSHQLVLASLPQVTTWNPKLAQTLHGVARQLLSAKVELRKEQEAFAPPPPMGMDVAGLPSGAPPPRLGM